MSSNLPKVDTQYFNRIVVGPGRELRTSWLESQRLNYYTNGLENDYQNGSVLTEDNE